MIRRLDDIPIVLPLDAIAELCRKYDLDELAIFGSALREDFGPDSDIDFLVVFKNDDYGPWMGKLTRFEDDLSALLGRKAEVIPKKVTVHGVESAFFEGKRGFPTCWSLF